MLLDAVTFLGVFYVTLAIVKFFGSVWKSEEKARNCDVSKKNDTFALECTNKEIKNSHCEMMTNEVKYRSELELDQYQTEILKRRKRIAAGEVKGFYLADNALIDENNCGRYTGRAAGLDGRRPSYNGGYNADKTEIVRRRSLSKDVIGNNDDNTETLVAHGRMVGLIKDHERELRHSSSINDYKSNRINSQAQFQRQQRSSFEDRHFSVEMTPTKLADGIKTCHGAGSSFKISENSAFTPIQPKRREASVEGRPSLASNSNCGFVNHAQSFPDVSMDSGLNTEASIASSCSGTTQRNGEPAAFDQQWQDGKQMPPKIVWAAQNTQSDPSSFNDVTTNGIPEHPGNSTMPPNVKSSTATLTSTTALANATTMAKCRNNYDYYREKDAPPHPPPLPSAELVTVQLLKKHPAMSEHRHDASDQLQMALSKAMKGTGPGTVTRMNPHDATLFAFCGSVNGAQPAAVFEVAEKEKKPNYSTGMNGKEMEQDGRPRVVWRTKSDDVGRQEDEKRSSPDRLHSWFRGQQHEDSILDEILGPHNAAAVNDPIGLVDRVITGQGVPVNEDILKGGNVSFKTKLFEALAEQESHEFEIHNCHPRRNSKITFASALSNGAFLSGPKRKKIERSHTAPDEENGSECNKEMEQGRFHDYQVSKDNAMIEFPPVPVSPRAIRKEMATLEKPHQFQQAQMVQPQCRVKRRTSMNEILQQPSTNPIRIEENDTRKEPENSFEDEMSKMSLAQKAKLFEQKAEELAEQKKRYNEIRRRTQPVTTDEVMKARSLLRDQLTKAVGNRNPVRPKFGRVENNGIEQWPEKAKVKNGNDDRHFVNTKFKPQWIDDSLSIPDRFLQQPVVPQVKPRKVVYLHSNGSNNDAKQDSQIPNIM